MAVARPIPDPAPDTSATLPSNFMSVVERARTQLEVHDQRARQRLPWSAGTRRVDTFDVHGRTIARCHPEAAALPARLGIVDPAVHALGEEAHRIWHAKLDHFPVRQRVERIGVVARADRRVRAESQRVVLIHPRVVRSLGRAVASRERGTGNRIERPALGAAVAVIGTWSVEGPLALRAIEARDVAARQRHPRNSLPVDVEAAHAKTGGRNLVHFRERSFARIRAEVDADDPARVADVRSPDRAVGRTRRDSIEPEAEPLVLGRILRLTGLDPRVALTVAVGVDDQRGPSL